MSSVDERTVKMQFDNDTFMKRAKDTQKTLADVNKSVDSAGKSKGLLDLNANMERVSVTASKMAVVTTAALATITSKLVTVGLSLAKSLAIDPIRQGFSEYESLLTKQNTIMNATGQSAKVVKGFLNDLNKYSDQTIYSFGNMTESITKFVNAGVPLPRAVTSIKGIANAAAFAGASTEEANRAMFAFSQSMQTGFIMLNDWQQIENANMGTIQFKNELIKAGVAAGTLTKRGNEYITSSGKAVSATKGWREGLADQWATVGVLNTALGKYSDRTTKLGKKAFAAAQEVRTFSAFIDTLKESIGSGWSQIFTALFGNLNQATKLWSGLSTSVGGAVTAFFNFASTTLKTWRKMGGFEKTLQGFANILSPIKALLKAVGDAWGAAFPDSGKGAGKALYGLSAAFELLTRPLTWLASGIPAITGPLTIFFQLLRLGGQIVGRVATDFADFVRELVGLVDIDMPESDGILGYIKKIGVAVGGALSQISDLIAKGSSLKDAIGSVDISLPGLPDFGSMLGGGDKAKGAMDGVGAEASSVGDKVSAVFVKMGEGLKWIKDQLANLFSGMTGDDLVAGFNLAVLSTLALSISRFLNAITGNITSFKGTGKIFKETLEKAGDALGSFQTQARAKLILNIGIAIGILAASLWLLSKIPADKLVSALGAMGILFFMLNKTMENFTKTLKGTDGVVKGFNFVALAVSIGILAAAMILLATACLIMNKVEWQSIAKGIIVMAVAMKMMERLGETSKGASKNMVAGAFAIALVAGAMIVLAGALLLFKLVDWGSMAKAGVALAGLTLAVGVLALIPYEGIAKVGAALLIASAGLLVLANALLIFQLVKWGAMLKAGVALTALTVALAIIMAVGGPASAATMLALAAAMVMLALACIMFNNVEWASIAKATVVLTLLLAALAVGAVILTVFLYAIAPLTPVLMALAAAFALLGLGMLAFASAMSIAMVLGAAGTAAFAALATGAAVAIAVFLQTLALQAPIMKNSFLKILQALIDTIVEAVPMVIQGIKDLWAAVKKEFTDNGKKKDAEDAGKSWTEKIGDGIKKIMPKIAAKAVELAKKFLNALDEHLPQLLTMGIYFVTKLIDGIGQRIGPLVDAAVNLVVKFAEALGNNLQKIVRAGVDLIANFLHDLADEIRSGSGKIGAGLADVAGAMASIGVNMIKGMVKGLGSVEDNPAVKRIGDIVNKMIEIAKKLPIIKSPSRVFMAIGKFMVEGLTLGVQNNAAAAITAVGSMVGGQIAVAAAYVSKFVQMLDQQAIKARGIADGVSRAADKAAKAAERQQRKAQATKTKKDDKKADKAAAAADRLGNRADKLDTAATRKEERASKAAEQAERKREFAGASLIDKAKMRSEDAQTQIDEGKQHEKEAAAYLAEAAALDRQSKAKGVSAKERKAMQKEADRLRKKAKAEAQAANKSLANSRLSAADAIRLQGLAGKEAADAFQKEYDDAAKQDAQEDAFNKLTDVEKAKARRKAAAELQAKSQKDLADAKILAKTDLDAANALADQAIEEAQRARDYLDEAAGYEQGNGVSPGQVVNLDPTEAASLAFNGYADTYDAASLRAADGASVEFNQYITTPDPADPAEVYRRTNNAIEFGASKLHPAA